MCQEKPTVFHTPLPLENDMRWSIVDGNDGGSCRGGSAFPAVEKLRKRRHCSDNANDRDSERIAECICRRDTNPQRGESAGTGMNDDLRNMSRRRFLRSEKFPYSIRKCFGKRPVGSPPLLSENCIAIREPDGDLRRGCINKKFQSCSRILCRFQFLRQQRRWSKHTLQ